MRSPTYALIWEQWRQVRTPVIFAIALTVLASWTLHFTMELSLQSQSNKVWTQTESEDWGTASMALAAICMILVMSALAFTHSNTRDLRMGLPARLLTLPISQIRLASAQIAFRIFAVAIVALIISALVALIDPWYAQMILPSVGITVLGYSYVTLVATTIGKRTPVIASVVILLTITPVIGSLFAMEDALANQPANLIAVKPGHIAPQHNRSMVVFGAFFITCVGVSIYRFATIRNAAPIQIMMLRGQNPAQSHAGGFDNAMHYRYEWRRLSWLYPSFAVGILVLYLLPLNILARVTFSDDLFYAALITTPPLAGFIVGMILIAREHRDSVTGVARFMWTRPVTVQDVVLSRMKALGLSILYTYLLLGAVALLAALFSGVSLNVRILEFLFCLGSFCAVIIGVWSLVWVPFLPVLLWIVGVTCIAISTMTKWTLLGDFSFWIVDLLFWFILFFLAKGCARRQLFERRVVLRFVIFCTVLAAVANSFYFIWLDNYFRTASVSSLFVPAAITVSALPLFALLWQGFFLDRVRHNALFRRLPARDS